VYGLYVGFELTTPGNIRVAVKTDKGIRVISTSKYKGVSEGGAIDIAADVQRAADRMIMDSVEIQIPADGSQEVKDAVVEEQYSNDGDELIDGAVRDERVSEIGDSVITKVDGGDQETSLDSQRHQRQRYLKTTSDDWETEGTDEVMDQIELREERGKELASRNKAIFHDRSEYNPVNHPSRGERAMRRTSEPMMGLYTSLLRDGWVVHSRAQEVKEYEAMLANRDYIEAVEDIVDEVSLKNMHQVTEAMELRRNIAEAMFAHFKESGSGYFTDWSNFCNVESYFVDYLAECFVKIGEVPSDYEYKEIDGFRAVTENVPRSFSEALRSPIWGESARKELNDLLEKAMIRIPADIALEGIAKGCDCLILFPVFESKIRDGKQIYKVRLVADGRKHSTAGPTYSSTPSREEFLMFIDMIARLQWEWCHVDENRAFLNADRQDQIPLYARLKGEKDWFQIIRALYGLKTSTRDHSIAAALRLEKLGFVRRGMCTNIFERFVLNEDGSASHVIVYQYVDDYFFAGNTREAVESVVAKFRSVVGTSEPAFDPEKGLGMEFVRDRSKRTISIRMSATIQRMYDEFVDEANKSKKIDLPIPKGKYIVDKSDFDDMEIENDPDGIKVSSEDRSLYMKQVGAILWVAGIRFDINLPTVYLTWFTHEPRQHHLKLAERVIRYLGQTKDEPLVLGGLTPAQIITLSDCSLGTGPKGRSIIAYGTRMGPSSGFIATKVKATQYMALSSFEGEINGYFESFRTSARYANIAKEMSYKVDPTRIIIGDNEKAIQFIKGEAEGKGIRHALRRFSYMREEFSKGNIDLQWQSGKSLVVDAMTKVVDVEAFQRFRSDVLGHALLQEEGVSG
jgi:Reverse transcriptase (RNA-dependent DNA polymerase)